MDRGALQGSPTGVEISALRYARLSGIGLERAAELDRDPAPGPGSASWGRGRGGAAGASHGNAAGGLPRIWREKFISLFNLRMIYSFSLPRIFDKGEKCCPCILWRSCPIYQHALSARSPCCPPPWVFVFEELIPLCTTRKGHRHEEFYLLTVPKTMWNPSPQSCADRSVLFPMSVSLSHLSPPPPVALPLASARALAGAPPRLLCC